MKASPACLDLIKRFEGFRSLPYICPAGKPTQGWGHTRGVGLNDGPVTEAQAHEWLLSDVAEAERIVADRVTVPMTQGQFDALVSFVFNIGQSKFNVSQCTLLRWFNAGHPVDLVAGQFLRWVHSRDPQTGLSAKLPGLVARREAERQLFLSSEA